MPHWIDQLIETRSRIPFVISVALVIIMAVGCVSVAAYMSKRKSKKGKKELLDNVSATTPVAPKEAVHETELKQEEIPIKPTFFDAGSGTVMSGSEFIPSQFLSPWYKAYTGNVKNQYLLDDGADGAAGLQFNQCSKSCCSEQYPLPFKMPVDSSVCGSKDEFVPNNYTCNNAWQDSGCVCMTKKQANFIGSRGGNA